MIVKLPTQKDIGELLVAPKDIFSPQSAAAVHNKQQLALSIGPGVQSSLLIAQWDLQMM